MALFDKLNDIAKNITDKTGDVIETGKLNGKINTEKKAADDALVKVGEYYYNIYISGGEVAPEVVEFCEVAKTHFDAIAAAQGEIDRIKTENAEQRATAQAAAQAQAEPAAPVPAAPAPRFCGGCGTEVAPGVKFCPQCGTKME